MGHHRDAGTVTEGKIRSREEAVRWRRALRGTVAFTNGVFDLLHPGHVAVLEGARAQADALVVGVNDDASSSALGKPGRRPVMPAAARARVLAACAAVDCVVLFPEATPEALIDALRPDVLVKGGDYALDAIPGRRLVADRGGRVATVPLVAPYSTSAILERIRDAT